jgi:hypothetical protein
MPSSVSMTGLRIIIKIRRLAGQATAELSMLWTVNTPRYASIRSL